MSDARSFCLMATHFLRLAENAAELLVRQANAHAIVSNAPLSPAQYNRRTRWSDHAVGVALLFNFYHGVELVLKGCLALYGPPSASHSLTGLLAQLQAKAPGTPLIATLEPFVKNIDPTSPVGEFLASNNITIDAWYQALKYPKSTSGRVFSHMRLKYGASRTLKYWSSLRRTSTTVRKQAVQLIRQIEGA
jgi:HEPN domain-containing protein